MRVLVAPDCFTGTLSAPEAADALAEGWLTGSRGDTVERCPLSDGGPGFLEVLHAALGGTVREVRVGGPTGAPTPARLLLHTGPDGVPTAYLETAQACGAHLVRPPDRDPRRTGTGGVGELLVHARRSGARRIVLGLGGSGTNDAGAGMLLSLAGAEGLVEDPGRARALLGSGGAALRGIAPRDLGFLRPLRERWRDIELVAATDVDSPLLGPRGASLGFSPQKGATPRQALELEAALGDLAAAVRALRPDLPADLPGAGAAGGLGLALVLLGACRAAGADTVMSAVDFAGRVAGHDLVITGEGRFDWQSLRGKVVSAVAGQGERSGVPVVVVAGQVAPGTPRRPAGILAVHAVVRDGEDPARALADPHRTLAQTARLVAGRFGDLPQEHAGRAGRVRDAAGPRTRTLEPTAPGPDRNGNRRDRGPRTARAHREPRGEHPMTVQDETTEPNGPEGTAHGVALTQVAVEKVRDLLAKEDRDDLRLRVGVQPGGCSGLIYQLYFDERVLEGDLVRSFGTVEVVVDPKSAPYLDGATIDFTDTISKQGFTIDNPNAAGTCACGDSFH